MNTMDLRKLRVKFFQLTFPRKLYHGNPIEKYPAVARKIDKWFFDGDNMFCLPKDGVIRIGESAAGQDNVVLPSQVVDHFIDRAGYIAIMNFCMCRESMECKDYPRDLGCVFMGEAARGIHPDLCRPATAEEAKEHVRKCREAGMVHVIGKSKTDTVWLDIGPGEKLLTVCNCCPCCCITRMTPYLPDLIADKLMGMPGVTVEVTDDCVGCGECVDQGFCIFEAMSIEDGRARISDKCRHCGRCVERCPNKAIQVRIDNETFIGDMIERVGGHVDID